MFNLNPRVHFNEIELAVFIQELKGSRATVFNLAACLCAALTDPLNQLPIHADRWSLFNHFLMTTLHGAISLSEPHRITSTIREHLDFDVTRILQEFF